MTKDFSPHARRLADQLRAQALSNIERIRSEHDNLSAHRTRRNTPLPLHPPAALIAAIDAVFEQPIEDRD